jgi:GNAT superfamily N-acetyltransferase
MIRQAGPGDEDLVRTLRLRALSDAEFAFDSTLARERAWGPSDWKHWLAEGATFVFEGPGGPAGIAAGFPHWTVKNAVLLASMWVDPMSRGSGAANALVEAVVAWARTHGAREVLLDVGKENAAARRCYERNGFRATGHEFVRERDGTVEIEMRLTLDGTGANGETEAE